MYKIVVNLFYKLPRSPQQYFKRIYLRFWRFFEVSRYIIAKINFNIIWPFLPFHKDFSINKFEQKIYSQNGEDGIIHYLFNIIGTTNKYCVEFGVGDGSECNTRYLIEAEEWKYLHMDAEADPNGNIKKEVITAENINILLKKYGVPSEFDLLSIDIDSNEYWIWKAIENYLPRVVIIEYNASIPVTESMTIAYDPFFKWDVSSYYGASLLALVIIFWLILNIS